MHRLAASIALALSVSLAAGPLAARAQVAAAVQVHVGLPPAPRLVVVQPGVQVVENWDEEVFYTGGWYWVRRDGRWFRARGPRAAFVYVEPRRVPVALVRAPPGQYRHLHKAEAKAERRAWKAQAKAEKHAWKAEREEHGRGHGHR